MASVRENRIKTAMREGRKAYGYNLVFPSPWVVEVLGYLDFDFVWIDGEHGPWSLDQLEDICRVASQAGATPVARVPDIGSSTILRFLDRGVQGIMGPHISTKAEKEKLSCLTCSSVGLSRTMRIALTKATRRWKLPSSSAKIFIPRVFQRKSLRFSLPTTFVHIPVRSMRDYSFTIIMRSTMFISISRTKH